MAVNKTVANAFKVIHAEEQLREAIEQSFIGDAQNHDIKDGLLVITYKFWVVDGKIICVKE